MMEAVTGADQVLDQLDSFRRGVGSIARQAVGKAAQSAAGSIRNRISHAGVRSTIGYRMLNTRGEVSEAKIGAAVGKSTATTVKNRGGRSGVGIDASNVHWWFLGTADRYTGTRRSRSGRKDTGKRKRFTGRMPPQERPISVLFDRNGTVQVLRTWIDVGVKAELT
jgi:hypothetical protein